MNFFKISDRLVDQLKKHEGFRAHPYKCTAGKLTIGFGRNLDDNGITEVEARYLLMNDLKRTIMELERFFGDDFWQELCLDHPERTDVLVNMAYNIGIPAFKTFSRMLDALYAFDFDRAADEMLDSKWAEQVGGRSEELARQMRLGHYANH